MAGGASAVPLLGRAVDRWGVQRRHLDAGGMNPQVLTVLNLLDRGLRPASLRIGGEASLRDMLGPPAVATCRRASAEPLHTADVFAGHEVTLSWQRASRRTDAGVVLVDVIGPLPSAGRAVSIWPADFRAHGVGEAKHQFLSEAGRKLRADGHRCNPRRKW